MFKVAILQKRSINEQILATGDVLDQAVYDISGLADANHNMDKLYIAIEIAKRI